MARTVGANRQQSKEVQHRPKITTPEWLHAAVACMADIQPSALGTGCHPGSETSVGLPGQQKLYVRRSHMRPEPRHDELHTFRSETEPRRHCRNVGWIRAVAESHCRHDMIISAGYTVRWNKCISDCSFFVFLFQYFAYCFPCFFPIISMHVKFFFEVIFLCNSDYVR